MSTVHRQRAVLSLQKRNFPHLLEQAKAFYNGLSGNPTLFVNPNPQLVTFKSKILAFDQAQQVAVTRAIGAAPLLRQARAGPPVKPAGRALLAQHAPCRR